MTRLKLKNAAPVLPLRSLSAEVSHDDPDSFVRFRHRWWLGAVGAGLLLAGLAILVSVFASGR